MKKTNSIIICLVMCFILSSCASTRCVGNCTNGQGTMTFASGNKYVGEWKYDMRNGQGTNTFANGQKHVGEYKNGKRNGRGTYTFPNGEKYVGEYKDDKKNGQGTLTFANGEKYVGEYKDDKRNGQGTYTFANGQKHVGEYKDGKRNGQGTYTWPNGDIYAGEFKDKMHGKGTKTYASGNKYVGEWKDDKKNGQGTYTFANGTKEIGEWKNDKFVKTLPIEDMPDFVLASKHIASKAIAHSKDISDDMSDIEQNIPESKETNKYAIAVVIGNRNYKKTRNVDFAVNDAQIIKQYLIATMGYKEGNIFYIENALKTDFELYFGNKESHKGKLYNAVREGKSDVFVYYSGHGAPGLKDKKGYFVPVDADPQYLELNGYSADVFYQNLSKIPARSVNVIIDACFSGATIYDNISPAYIEMKIDNPLIYMKNSAVLSSSSGAQVSSWYNEKKHGMFTYFFLKAIHNKNGDLDKDGKLTYTEIYNYISDESDGVPYYARRIHGVEQNPTIEGQYKDKVLVEY